jgi:hypothetical protein
MSTKSHSRVLFNDGEAVDFHDLNTAQDYQRIILLDQFLGTQAGQSFSASPSASYCLVPQPMAALPTQGGSARQVTNTEGMICQWSTAGSSDGITPRMLSYWLAAGELLSSGSGSMALAPTVHPRWDGIFIQIRDDLADTVTTRDFKDVATNALSSTTFSKRLGTRAYFQRVEGSEATSPIVPVTPSPSGGYNWVPFCYVYRTVGDDGVAFTPDVFADARMPMRVGSIVTPAINAIFTPGPNDFIRNIDTGSILGDSDICTGSGVVLFPFLGGAACRVTRVCVFGQLVSGFGTFTTRDMTRIQLAGALAVSNAGPVAAATQVSQPVGSYGTSMLGINTQPALWGNGYAGGPWTCAQGTAAYESSLLGVKFGGVAGQFNIQSVKWDFAY